MGAYFDPEDFFAGERDGLDHGVDLLALLLELAGGLADEFDGLSAGLFVLGHFLCCLKLWILGKL